MIRDASFGLARRQRGVATLLILLLIGLAMTVTVLAAVHAQRGNQQRELGIHADAAARAAAWRGVETLRQAVQAAGTAKLRSWSGLSDDASWSATCATNEAGTVNLAAEDLASLQVTDAHLTRVCRTETENVYRVTARVTGCAGSQCATDPVSRLATATVEVVYEVKPDSASSGSPSGESGSTAPAVITFNNNLNLSGSITVLKDAGTQYQLNVNGDLTTGGNTITGVDTIRATGSIRISSGSTFGTLESNGDIKFDGSVTATQAVLARGNICIEGGASASGAAVKANGSVLANGGVTLGDVQAIGQSDRDEETTAECPTVAIDGDGVAYAVDLQGNASARTVKADGSVRINSGSISTNDGLRASGHLLDTNCGGSESGIVGKSAEGPSNCPAGWSGVAVQSGLQVAISPVSPVVLDTSSFNAYTVESQAHYAFKIDANGFIVVTVRAIEGIPDGTYFLGDYEGAHKDYLCAALESGSTPGSRKCAGLVEDSLGTLCKGYSDWNNCIAWDSGAQRWSLNGTSLAPGIAWFEGNLEVGNGTYYNTFIATGDLSTGGSTVVYAMNYAGYDGNRMTSSGIKAYAPTGICVNSYFPGRYPSDYCNLLTARYEPPQDSVIGNYALLAGSYDASGHYVGGDIVLGSSNQIYGSVMSGNLYASGGSTTIHGTITALSQGDASHAAGGSTTIDLRSLPEGYTPTVDPCELDGSCPDTPAPATGGARASVLWSRYL